MITDAGITAGENSNTSLRRFALNAASCKFSRIIVFNSDEDITEYAGVQILKAELISKQNSSSLYDSLKKVSRGSIIYVEAGDNNFNRNAVNMKRVKFLTGISDMPKGGFDHILSKLLADKNVGVVLDFSKIVDRYSRRRALSQYADVLKFARKYKFPLVIASGADTCLMQKSVREITELGSLFGMKRSEIYSALNGVDFVINPKKSVEAVI